MRFFGSLTDDHLKDDAMAGLVIYLLTPAATLVYGGDLRDRRFTPLIFARVLRYRPRQEAVRDYPAWPLCTRVNADGIRELDEAFQGLARTIFVKHDGHPHPAEDTAPQSTVDEEAWCAGSTAMRELLSGCSEADLNNGLTPAEKTSVLRHMVTGAATLVIDVLRANGAAFRPVRRERGK